VSFEVELCCRDYSCVEAGRLGGEHEWLIDAPLDLHEALHNDTGIVLQGLPLGTLLNVGGPLASIELVVFQSRDAIHWLVSG